VFDRNGNIQYVLGAYRGQTYPLPFNTSMLSDGANTLRFDAPISSMQQLALNPDDLPSLRNQAFTQRMQQVFGSSFQGGQPTAAYPTNQSNNSTRTGVGATNTQPMNSNAAKAADQWMWPQNNRGLQGGTGFNLNETAPGQRQGIPIGEHPPFRYDPRWKMKN